MKACTMCPVVYDDAAWAKLPPARGGLHSLSVNDAGQTGLIETRNCTACGSTIAKFVAPETATLSLDHFEPGDKFTTSSGELCSYVGPDPDVKELHHVMRAGARATLSSAELVTFGWRGGDDGAS